VVLVEANIGQGQGHDLSGQNLWGDVVRFFGLDMDVAPDPGTGGADGSGSGGAVGAGGTTQASGTGGATSNGGGSGGAPSGSGSGGTSAGAGVGGSVTSSGGAGSDVTTSDDGGVPDDSAGGCQTGGPTRPLGLLGLGLIAAVVGWARLRRTASGS
jgi:hypothetical protein